AKPVYLLTYSVKYFTIAFYIYLVSAYVSVFDKCILTESLNCSVMIFGLFFLLKAMRQGNVLNYYLLAGACITVTVFIRPVMMTLFIPACLVLFYGVVFKKYPVKGILFFI